ncbi:MAG TPA: hypothetical protein DCP08_01630 [Chloroflexi bacterium]|nr:hypothetical protein [Chloroflexota bacterium]
MTTFEKIVGGILVGIGILLALVFLVGPLLLGYIRLIPTIIFGETLCPNILLVVALAVAVWFGQSVRDHEIKRGNQMKLSKET